MDDELQGTRPQIIILDDLSDLEVQVAAYRAAMRSGTAAIDALYVAYFGMPQDMTQRLADIIDASSIRFEAEPAAYDIREWEPLPRPLRAPARIKQAPRQPFRQVMRSVNRNR